MVNKDRIVPVQKTDLLSLYGTAMAIGNISFAVIAADDVEGNFTVTGTGAAGNKLANQPVKTLDFASGVTGGTVYFVADYAFDGIKVAGAAATIASGSVAIDEVVADGVTLYKAVLASSQVTITAVTPALVGA